jgi:hypothetical protein
MQGSRWIIFFNQRVIFEPKARSSWMWGLYERSVLLYQFFRIFARGLARKLEKSIRIFLVFSFFPCG